MGSELELASFPRLARPVASELVDLRWDQVDFRTATLHVRRVKEGTPSRRDRHAAPLSSQPALGPPDDRDARTKWSHLPSTRRRTKHPNPRCSGKLAHPRLAKNQPVIITVPRY